MGDVAGAMQLQELDDAPLRPKSSLMKKLSFLLHPKKSKSKSGSPSQKLPAASLPPPSSAGSSELELLFAQAEATLGELLVRAGASFEARSSSYSHADQHHHHHPVRGIDRSNGNGEDDASALIGSSSGSRSAKFSGQGHARRRSLSRAWQQLGGSLFCGSGHMSGYVMDQDMMAPAPASKGIYEDVVLDEAYWQSLADTMLLQQQRHQEQQQGAKLAADVALGQQELSCRNAKDVQNAEQQQTRVQYAEDLYIAEEEEDRESEIVPSIDVLDSMAKPWPPVCGSTSTTGRSSSQDMDSMYYRNLVDVESGGGRCTRLNTTLDESPNLAHNYLNMKVGGTSSVLNRSSCPEADSRRDSGEVQVPVQVAGSSSMQPLERFLSQARSVAGPSHLLSGSASSPSSRSAPESLTCQLEPSAVELSGTTSCRVSLMTLLHEEAAAGDSTATLDARQEEEEAEVAALLEDEGRRVRSMRSTMQEDPLQCCVCMIRRKGAALIPCGHTFCRTCAKQLFAGRGACPLCNNLIVQVLDIF